MKDGPRPHPGRSAWPLALPGVRSGRGVSRAGAGRTGLAAVARAVASPGAGGGQDCRPRRRAVALRRALVRWGFNPKQRSEPPDEVAEVLAWVAGNSAPVSALAEVAMARRILDQATGRLDRKNAAASTTRRNRTILANAMDYAIELGLLEMNPIRRIKWTMPKVSGQVDRRVCSAAYGAANCRRSPTGAHGSKRARRP